MLPQTAELPAGTFTYHVAGDPGAPPLLLLHAFGRDGTDWAPIAEPLAAHRRLIAPDQRGHGTSVYTADYSFELMRDDTAALLDLLGLDEVDVIAHSMGGTIAYLLAESRPSRVARLVIEDTPPPRGRREFAAPAEPSEPVSFDVNALRPIFGQLADPDPAWWEALATITSPTLVVAGGVESFIDQGELAAVAAEIPDARLVTIEAGHQVHGTKPAEFLAAVTPFLLG
jgi:3-oxoadipate enol-lactonase